jgi:hypothetical protein
VIQTKRQNKRLEQIRAEGGTGGQGQGQGAGAGGRLGRGLVVTQTVTRSTSPIAYQSLHELQLCIPYKVAITACTIQCNMPCTTCHGFRAIVTRDDNLRPPESASPRLRFRRCRVSRVDAISMNRSSGHLSRHVRELRLCTVVLEEGSRASPISSLARKR